MVCAGVELSVGAQVMVGVACSSWRLTIQQASGSPFVYSIDGYCSARHLRAIQIRALGNVLRAIVAASTILLAPYGWIGSCFTASRESQGVVNNGFDIRGSACARVRSVLLALAYLLACSTARADLVVPSGGLVSLAPGVADLACTDVIVAGTLQVNSGQLNNVRSVTIQPGGVIDGGSGTIQVGGNWTNAGTFNAGTGTVNFRDLCAFGNAVIMGTTTFFSASFVTSSGKNYVFAVNSTQTITSFLEIAGPAGNPIQFRSSLPGQVGFINLVNGGTQQIQHVGVTDVWATGQWLAPFLTNEGGGGNASRWFGTPDTAVAAPIPTLDTTLLIALSLLLAASAAQVLKRRGATLRRRAHNDAGAP